MQLIRKVLVALVVIFLGGMGTSECYAQQLSLKGNLLYAATTTPNLGMEVGIGKKHSIQLFYGLNLWEFGKTDDKKFFKHWLVTPEYRYWFCQRFNGSFIGIQALGGEFDAANMKLPFNYGKGLRKYRYVGWYVGGGISYGYQWVLSPHLNLEAEIGVGAAYVDYDRYKCGQCGKKTGEGHKTYVGPTNAALSLVYLL